jgi:CRP/FNR family transcriptional regulator, cyclic AMP receptor protein
MPTDAALLAEVPFFQLLDEAERTALAEQLDVVRVPAGQTVFNHGDPGDQLYIIRDGEVEVFFKDNTGQRIVLEHADRGHFFGEISLLDGGPRTASVLVTRDLEALRLDRGNLDRFLKSHPAAAMDLLAATGRRLRHTAERLRHTASRNVNEEMEDTRTMIQKTADWIAEFSGSISFLLIHLVLFFVWIILNVEFIKRFDSDVLRSMSQFDPFPFGLLTMAVSLEAIFLSVFVLLSQNRQAAKDRIRGDIEYDVNLKAELEVAHLHEKVDHLSAETVKRLDRIERSLDKRPSA